MLITLAIRPLQTAMRWGVVVLLLGLGIVAPRVGWALDTPPLYTNQWAVILVPAFDRGPTATGSNNLSVTGLNHSLRFAQMLERLLAGKEAEVKEIIAFTADHQKQDLTPLESIQPFAVSQNRSVTVSSLNITDPGAYNSPAAMMPQFLGTQPPGLYVMAGSAAMISALAEGLTGKPAPALSPGAYLVVSGPSGAMTAQVYTDGLPTVSTYPEIPLPPRAKNCPSSFSPVTVKAPPGLKFYPNQTVYMVRHVEAHPTDSFENGNYVCQGQWRALGANERLKEIMEGIPDFVFTSNIDGLIDCPRGGCSYIRPTLTVAPFAIAHDLPLTLARFQWNDPEDLAAALFDQASPYFPRSGSQSKILVGWEHGNIVKAVKVLFGHLYQNPKAAASLPDWPYTDYDTVWTLRTDSKGTLTLSGDCEHIPSAALPNSCPTVWQQ